MAIKLKSVLRNQAFTLTFKALVFGLSLFFYNSQPTLGRGGLFLLIAFWLYGHPLFNFLSFLPTFLALVFLSFWTGYAGGPLAGLAPWLISPCFGILLGLKNLLITNRRYWHYLIVLAASYLAWINFFLLDLSKFFWLKWPLVLLLTYFLFKDLLPDKVAVIFLCLITGELLWVISWLPIGFLGSANLLMAATLFLAEAMANKRLIWKNLVLLTGLVSVILLTSYWQI